MMRWRLSWREFAVAGVLVVVAGLVALPVFSRAREAARRASCQSNLKQMGIVFKMYAGENRDTWPPLSPRYNNWLPALGTLYPDYLADLSILICPASPFATKGRFTRGPGDLDAACVTSLFYNYTGYAIFADEQALALFDAYQQDPAAIRAAQRSIALVVPKLEGSNRLYGVVGQEQTPILWDRVPLEESEFSHSPRGINVLHQDGHVEFVRYGYYNNSNSFPATRIAAETFGSVLPRTPPDCTGF